MEYKNVSAILYDRIEGGLGYRSLAEKYGISRDQVHRMVMSNIISRKKSEKQSGWIELQDFMLDISSKEPGRKLHEMMAPSIGRS